MPLSTVKVHQYAHTMANSTAPSLSEAHALTQRLFAVAERARSDFGVVVGELGLTSMQARALLWLQEPSPMRALADYLCCDASNVTGLADRLEKQGLVERITGQDRRVTLLRLTTRGTRLRVDLARRVAEGSSVSARLTREERQQLGSILDKLLA